MTKIRIWLAIFLVGLVASGVTAFPLEGVVPLALFAGLVRGIPLRWSAIDISFGVLGVIPLLIARRMIKRLPSSKADNQDAPKKPLQLIHGAG